MSIEDAVEVFGVIQNHGQSKQQQMKVVKKLFLLFVNTQVHNLEDDTKNLLHRSAQRAGLVVSDDAPFHFTSLDQISMDCMVLDLWDKYAHWLGMKACYVENGKEILYALGSIDNYWSQSKQYFLWNHPERKSPDFKMPDVFQPSIWKVIQQNMRRRVAKY